ncbi:MAG: DNA polymerase III subunit beta family protein [Acidimicrobiales bacterium]
MAPRLSIGEFARASGLSVSALRFYDSAGLLVPVEVDDRTGYRTYDHDQLGAAQLIRDLRRLEMTLAAIAGFLAASGPERRKRLAEHLDGVSARLREVQNITKALQAHIDQQETATTTMTVTAAELCDAIDQVLPAAGTDPERPLLHSVLIEARDGSLRLVATDSYRLAVRDLVARDGTDATFKGAVAAARVARFRRSLTDDGSVQIGRTDSGLQVSGAGDDETLALMAMDYPDYEKLFSARPAAYSITVPRAVLDAALSTPGHREHHPATGHDIVRLHLCPDGLDVGTDLPVHLPATYDGPDMVIALNPDYASYASRSAIGPEVTVEVTDPTQPVVFRSATDSSFICLVMPISMG